MKKEMSAKSNLARILAGDFLLLASFLVLILYKSRKNGHLRLGDVTLVIVLWSLLCFFLPEMSFDKTIYRKFFRRLRIGFYPILLSMVFFSGGSSVGG